jgi:hypothetical protein
MLVLGADAEHYTRGRVCSPEFFVFRHIFESLNYQLAALLRVRLLHLVLQRFGPERPDADDAQDDQR